MTNWTPEKIRSLRTSYGETQLEFAKRFPVTVATLANWEQGRIVPPECMQTLLGFFKRDFDEGRVSRKRPA